jgi:hypothetical protein
MAFLSSFYPQPVVKGTTAGTFAEGNDPRLSDARTPLSHVHGNISNTGTIGSTSGLPVVTTTSGAISTLALGTANQVLRVNSGATGVEFGAGFDAASPPAIGSTTPSSGAFTTLSSAPTSGSALTLTGGTVTASAPVLDATQTWNASGTTFTALRLNATNTASASASLLADFQVGGTSVANIRRDGRVLATSFALVSGAQSGAGFFYHSATEESGHVAFVNNANSQMWTCTVSRFRLSGDLSFGRAVGLGQGVDTVLVRDDAGILAQRNAANAQTFRIYNTFTSTTNFERLNIIAQSAGSVIIGTEKGSAGGTARALEFQTDGVTRFGATDTGAFYVGTSPSFTSTGLQIQPTSNRGGLFFSNCSVDVSSSSVTIRGGSSATDWMRYVSNRLIFNGTTSSFPALKPSSATLQVRLADDSAFAGFSCGALTLNGNLDASTRDIVTDTTTGTKIGTSTTQKIGFFGATPVDQPALTADLLDSLQEVGLVASGSGNTPLNLSGGTLTAGNLVLTDNTGSETATFDAQNKLTANRTYDLPDASGTLALTSDITGGGTKTYAVFTATDNQPTATAFATLDTRNSIAVLDFDDATDESAVFVSIIPEAASLGSGLKIRLHWAATTATSGNVVWDVSLERMTTDLDSDSFDTIASGTAAANGTSGILTVTEITLTTIDSVTAGDGYRLKVTRDANAAGDTMSGDAELVLAEVRSAA